VVVRCLVFEKSAFKCATHGQTNGHYQSFKAPHYVSRRLN